MSVIYLLPNYNKHGKFNKMPPKAAQLSSVVIILGWGNTSIVESLDVDL